MEEQTGKMDCGKSNMIHEFWKIDEHAKSDQ